MESLAARGTERKTTGVGPRVGEYAHRQRLRSHGVFKFSGNPDGRAYVCGSLWRVSLFIRRLLLDESFWRPGISVPLPDNATLGNRSSSVSERRAPSV